MRRQGAVQRPRGRTRQATKERPSTLYRVVEGRNHAGKTDKLPQLLDENEEERLVYTKHKRKLKKG